MNCWFESSLPHKTPKSKSAGVSYLQKHYFIGSSPISANCADSPNGQGNFFPRNRNLVAI